MSGLFSIFALLSLFFGAQVRPYSTGHFLCSIKYGGGEFRAEKAALRKDLAAEQSTAFYLDTAKNSLS